MKQALSLLAALGFGALVTYAIMSPRHPEEWGVVVVHFGSGASLWGLFESKADCLDARTAFIKEYGQMAGAIKKGSRSMILDGGARGESVPVTFSCLPLSEIRGLSLADGRPSN